ncbi:MAG: hypothetical protein K6A70_02290 [Erysipelotrichaceae bacterium]|nr:hypothetical protein [Erysipelotrichaceae bacterium]
MNEIKEHDFATYPRRFKAYRWYKPLLSVLLIVVFMFVFTILIDLLTKILFNTSISNSGYDDMDFFSTAGAFNNGLKAASFIPAVLLAALIVRDRPLSSYFSSIGGWRWKVFFKTFVSGFVIVGLPSVLCFLLRGRTGEASFTLASFMLLLVLAPLQGVAEELLYRGFFMQTAAALLFNLVLKALFCLFIFYAQRKLRWFDDVMKFNAKGD